MIVSGAVITADMVNSTALGTEAAAKLTNRLQQLIAANNAKFLFYRGDSFQSYLVDPYPAYRLALLLRTEARLFELEMPEVKTDLKISIGVGNIDTPVLNISTAKGEAFLLSGRGLEMLEQSGKRMLIQSEKPVVNLALSSISLFTDYLFEKLTFKQAEVLQHLLQNRTQIETAKILNKSQSTINRHVQWEKRREEEELLELYKSAIGLE